MTTTAMTRGRSNEFYHPRGWSREPQSAGAPKLTEFRVKFESATLGASWRDPLSLPLPRATGVTLSDESRYVGGGTEVVSYRLV